SGKVVKLTRVGGTFVAPVYVTSPPKDATRLFVATRSGVIWEVRGGVRRWQPYLDLSGRVGDTAEQGFGGIAFHPDFADNGLFYVHFPNVDGDNEVLEFRETAGNINRADPDSERQVLFVDMPGDHHNGGQISFGPDGYLYLGIGDGGKGPNDEVAVGHGQIRGSLMGNILRIDPTGDEPLEYSVPTDNPFIGETDIHGDPVRPEIWSYGLRQPWRFSFDRANGDLYIADVGSSSREEFDYLPAGQVANFGWPCFEGSLSKAHWGFDCDWSVPHTPPVHEYGTGSSWCSAMGGYVVRDDRLTDLAGYYLYSDFCSGALKAFTMVDGEAVDDQRVTISPLSDSAIPPNAVRNPSSFGEDARGRVYIVSLTAGEVYRIDPST
ncbi:MAG TPA: PQQ-dependent sugar dehydrogenase, partial [Acidimicrobiales bacterium]